MYILQEEASEISPVGPPNINRVNVTSEPIFLWNPIEMGKEARIWNN
jgi:hypothetical protein